MNIIKKTQKYSYTEKKDKNNKNLVCANIKGHLEDIIHNKPPAGEALVHETNKHISNSFKDNYDKINWADKISKTNKIHDLNSKKIYIY